MGNISFYLKKPDAKTGNSLILLQWKYRGQRLVFSFGETINPKDWNKKLQRVKSNKQTTSDGEHGLNDLLDNLKSVCKKAYYDEIKNGIPLPATIKQHLIDFMNQNKDSDKKVKNRPTIWSLIDRFISGEVRDKNNKKKTEGTIKNYRTVKGHLQYFEDETKYKVSFDSINRDFLDKYLDYLENDAWIINKRGKRVLRKALSPNTIAKNLQIIKVFLKEGLDRGYHKNEWFRDNLTRSWEESEQVALTRLEIDKLFRHDFSSNPKFERIRDLFVFGCNVGLRISDFSNIKPHHIIEINGEKRIKIKTQKTGGIVEIPCYHQIPEIFERYKENANSLPKSVSDVEFNRVIKQVCKEAGMTKKGRLIKEPEKQLYECIVSHTCRRSFCTNLYNEGVPPVVIMKISGHKTESSFLKYIKVSQQDAADKLSAHFKQMEVSKLKAV